jgi:hypothetical protein
VIEAGTTPNDLPAVPGGRVHIRTRAAAVERMRGFEEFAPVITTDVTTGDLSPGY